jgi:type IV secretory pathway VirB10-like protein
MKTSTYLSLAAFFLLFAGVSAAATTVYKWKDSNGQVHYSDQPPPTGQAETVTVKNPRRKPAPEPVMTEEETASTPAQTEQPPAMSDEQKAAKEAMKRQQEEQKKIIRKKNCGIAKRNLKTLKSTVRVRKLDPKTGEYVRVSDQERLKKLKQYQRKVREYCR